MKQFRLALIFGFFAASVSGCTYSDAPHPGSTHSETPAPTPTTSAPSMHPRTLSGEFQSQAAVTSGSATLRVTETGAALHLEDFSTEQGDDLRLMLSPGTLSPNVKGELGLTSSALIDLGPLKQSANQRIDMDTKMWAAMPSPVRSVVIFDMAVRAAYGTANLTDLQAKAGSSTSETQPAVSEKSP